MMETYLLGDIGMVELGGLHVSRRFCRVMKRLATGTWLEGSGLLAKA